MKKDYFATITNGVFKKFIKKLTIEQKRELIEYFQTQVMKLDPKPFDEIFIFPNGMVAVFFNNEQVPKYQGRWSQKKILILPFLKQYPDIIVHGDINQTKRLWEIERYGDKE